MTALIKKKSFKSNKMFILSILMVVMCVSFILGSVIVKADNRNTTAEEHLYYTNYAVCEGESLWSISKKYMDYNHYDDINDYMDKLIEINGLSSEYLYAGQNLVIAYYSSDVSED
ncbi:MAG: LysM peptidoglycan-binding domain-containing protein [Butyrivibrio sp.]